MLTETWRTLQAVIVSSSFLSIFKSRLEKLKEKGKRYLKADKGSNFISGKLNFGKRLLQENTSRCSTSRLYNMYYSKGHAVHTRAVKLSSLQLFRFCFWFLIYEVFESQFLQWFVSHKLPKLKTTKRQEPFCSTAYKRENGSIFHII